MGERGAVGVTKLSTLPPRTQAEPKDLMLEIKPQDTSEGAKLTGEPQEGEQHEIQMEEMTEPLLKPTAEICQPRGT